MNKKTIIPWENRPENSSEVMWRFSKNPVIGRYHIPTSNSIFNSAVVPFEDGFAGSVNYRLVLNGGGSFRSFSGSTDAGYQNEKSDNKYSYDCFEGSHFINQNLIFSAGSSQ